MLFAVMIPFIIWFLLICRQNDVVQYAIKTNGINYFVYRYPRPSKDRDNNLVPILNKKGQAMAFDTLNKAKRCIWKWNCVHENRDSIVIRIFKSDSDFLCELKKSTEYDCMGNHTMDYVEY